MIRKPFLIPFLFLFTLAIRAQEISFHPLNGYKLTVNQVYTPDNIRDFLGAAADRYMAYGLIDLNLAEYKKGKNLIRVEAYRQKSINQAFGIYSSERLASFRYMNLGAQGYSNARFVNFFKGEYYVKISSLNQNEKNLQAAESLASQIANMLKGENALPSVLNQFPDEGKKKSEEIFIPQNVLGHKFLTNAFKANYEALNSAFSIFILDKPDHRSVMETVNEYLKSAASDQTEDESGKYVIKDGINGTIFLSWKENRIVVISGLEKDQSDIADRYTTEILH